MRDITGLPYPPVVISTDDTGREHRVGAHEWRTVERPNGGVVTVSIYVGDHRWVEALLDPQSAKMLADLILSRPCVAALAADAKGAGPVVVKPLEWNGPDCDGEHWASREKYVVLASNEDGYWLSGVGGFFPTVEAAKAAAQADFDTRIRSAIVDPHAATASEVDSDGDEIISPYEWLAQEFERLAVLRKMWTSFEVAEIIRRHDIYRPAPPAALGAGSTPDGWSAALKDVADERQRQISGEGWTPEHDDAHDAGEMARAAGIYALIAGADATAYRNAREGYHLGDYLQAVMDHYWPWDRRCFKATTPRRDLVKAGALIVAEIERRDRTGSPAAPGEAP